MTRNNGLQPIGAALDRLGERIRQRNRERIAAEVFERAAECVLREENGRQSNVSTVHEEMERAKAASTVRKPPRGDEQSDFFVPSLYNVGTRDNRSMMDVALFRLSKRDKRAGEITGRLFTSHWGPVSAILVVYRCNRHVRKAVVF